MNNKSSYYIVNRTHPLPPDYIPVDLVVAPIPFIASMDDPKRLICSIMYFPLHALYLDAKNEGLDLYGISAYRSYERQLEIYNESVRKRGRTYTNRYIAKPGTSEHQTGLAIDLSCPSNDFELNENFAISEEGIWLAENAYRYGFEFSYPKEYVMETGYNYEPWHIRYTCKFADYYVY